MRAGSRSVLSIAASVGQNGNAAYTLIDATCHKDAVSTQEVQHAINCACDTANHLLSAEAGATAVVMDAASIHNVNLPQGTVLLDCLYHKFSNALRTAFLKPCTYPFTSRTAAANEHQYCNANSRVYERICSLNRRADKKCKK